MTIKNVLVIIGDDLDYNVEPFVAPHPDIVTPNLKRLGERSLVCQNAAIVAWACSPHRIGLLYGQAAHRTGAYNNQAMIDDVYPLDQRLSWVGGLRNAGWSTYQRGKIGHTNDDGDWTDAIDPKGDKYDAPFTAAVAQGLLPSSFDFGVVPEGHGELCDQISVRELCETIHKGAEKHLWALGLHRPHFPAVVPQQFIDLIPNPPSYPPGVILNANGDFDPYDNTAIAAQLEPAVIQRVVMPNVKVPRAFSDTGEYLPHVRHYRAAVAYMDSLVGQVLDRLDACGLFDSTLIIFTSDGGIQQGEKNSARKFALWEKVARIPMMIAGPGIVPRHVDDPVSSLDIYRTMVDLFGIVPPHPLDGESLVPLFDGAGTLARRATISCGAVKNQPDKVCATARTVDHRIIRYWPGSAPNGQCAVELYDHGAGDRHEHINLAKVSPRPPATQALIDDLITLLPATMAPPILGAGDDE